MGHISYIFGMCFGPKSQKFNMRLQIQKIPRTRHTHKIHSLLGPKYQTQHEIATF